MTTWDFVKADPSIAIIVALVFGAVQIWLLRDKKKGSKWIAIFLAAVVELLVGVAITIAPFNTPHFSLSSLGLDSVQSLLFQATFVASAIVTTLVYAGRDEF